MRVGISSPNSAVPEALWLHADLAAPGIRIDELEANEACETVPQSVPVGILISAKCWSEWQDLNLRPPRPE